MNFQLGYFSVKPIVILIAALAVVIGTVTGVLVLICRYGLTMSG